MTQLAFNETYQPRCPYFLCWHTRDGVYKTRGIAYCEATLRAAVSSFSRTMLLVSNSGKMIGSSLFPG
jgi:hypothetical protein